MESNPRHMADVSKNILLNVPRPILWFYFFILIVILAIGEVSYQILKDRIVRQKSLEISSIAELKVQQISDFRERRLHDAQLFHGNQTFIEAVKRYINGHDLKSEDEIKDWLTPIFKNHFYNDIAIINPETKKNIFAFRKSHLEVSAQVESEDLKCLEFDRIIFGDFTPSQEDSVNLTILVPLILRKESLSEKIAVVKFFLDPHQKLYELMQSMPNRGRTGEVLVVKRDGNDVLYLNELRFQKNSALKLRLPITKKDLPAARALLGDDSVSEGIDYRGVKVLAIARLVPGTDWSVIVKFDVAEIYSELKTLAILIFGMVFILLIALGSGLHAISARKKLNYYKLRVNDLMTIQRLNHVYKLLNEVEQAIVKHNTKEALLNEICRIIANEGSYSLCWIGILNDKTGYLELIEQCLSERKYQLTIQAGITQKFMESQYPSTKAVYEGRSFISNNLQTDFSLKELKEKAIPAEFHSMAAIPLQQCSVTIGAFYFYANDTGFFTKEEVNLLERLSADLSFALDKIKQEEILKKSEQRFRSLVLASSEVLYRMNSDWSAMLQLNSNDFLANTIKSNPNWLNDYIHPDDQPLVTASIKEAIRTKSIFVLEHRVLKADSSWGWTLSRAVPSLDENGEISEWFGTAIDLTRRKLAEEALRENEEKFSAIFRSNPNAIVLSHKKDGKIIDVNDAFLTLLGRTREEVIGKTSYQLTMFSNPEDRSKAVAKLSAEEQVYNQEVKIRRASGEERTVILSIVPLHLNGINAMVTTLQDMTDRKLMEEELLTRANRLRELNATKDKLFSILSHDLKGPFTSIVGFSELLIENIRKNDFEDIENFATVISESSHNAMNLLTNLIEWSRLQTGRIKFNPTLFDINSIISEVVDLLFASARQKSINITSDIPSRLNIFADIFMINTVLRNLISNAVKFSYPEGKILISALKKESAVMIKISDNGVGMSQEAIEKLFNFESNFSTTGTQNEKGTGLGMIICKEFVTTHKGKIWVESEIGKGTSVIFTLPSKTN